MLIWLSSASSCVRPDSRATGEVAIRLRTMRAAGAAAPQPARADHAAGDLRPLRALAYDVHANCLLSTSMPQAHSRRRPIVGGC